MADYPNGVYSPRTKENEADVVYDEDKSTIGYAEDVSLLDDEVVAIETELGADPKWDSADVAERLKGIRSLSDSNKDLINIKVANVGIGTNNPLAQLHTTGGRIKKTTRITSSPYNVLVTDDVIFVDTDGGNITVNLPAGIDGATYRIINVGSSGNNAIISPNGAELLNGVNGDENLIDGESLILTYETTEGWW